MFHHWGRSQIYRENKLSQTPYKEGLLFWTKTSGKTISTITRENNQEDVLSGCGKLAKKYVTTDPRWNGETPTFFFMRVPKWRNLLDGNVTVYDHVLSGHRTSEMRKICADQLADSEEIPSSSKRSTPRQQGWTMKSLERTIWKSLGRGLFKADQKYTNSTLKFVKLRFHTWECWLN